MSTPFLQTDSGGEQQLDWQSPASPPFGYQASAASIQVRQVDEEDASDSIYSQAAEVSDDDDEMEEAEAMGDFVDDPDERRTKYVSLCLELL